MLLYCVICRKHHKPGRCSGLVSPERVQRTEVSAIPATLPGSDLGVILQDMTDREPVDYDHPSYYGPGDNR